MNESSAPEIRQVFQLTVERSLSSWRVAHSQREILARSWFRIYVCTFLDEFTGGIREIAFFPCRLVLREPAIQRKAGFLDDAGETRDFKATILQSFGGWMRNGTKGGRVLCVENRLGSIPRSIPSVWGTGFYRWNINTSGSPQPVHKHRYARRSGPDRVIYTGGNREKNGPCAHLESYHRAVRRVIWSER